MRVEFLMAKAKHETTNEWITGYYAEQNGSSHIGQTDGNNYPIDKSTVCCSSGQIDRFGDMIYENDILVDEEGFLVVRWEDKKSAFVLDAYGFPEYLAESGIEETSSRFSCCGTLDFDEFYTLDHFVIVGNTIDNPEFKKDGMLPKEALDKARIAYFAGNISVTKTCRGTACVGICEYEGKTYSVELVPDERNVVDICWQMAEHIAAELDKEEAERDR